MQNKGHLFDSMRPYDLIATGLLVFLLFSPASLAAETDLAFTDAAGRPIRIAQTPRQIVSLVPAVTEILFRLGAGDAVAGVTYHDVYPPEAATKPVVGGYFAPSPARIGSLQPDVVFIDEGHRSVVAGLAGRRTPVPIELPLSNLDDLFGSIRLLGRMLHRDAAAGDLVREIQDDLAHTADKLASIPTDQRRRVMRLMGRGEVMTPGADSFQNELIRQAGGIAPDFGRTGDIVAVSLAEWQAFNPQVLYGCGDDRETAQRLLDRPGWREVDAVQNGRVIYFPCDLTCRLSTRSGYFVSCLASRIYGDVFAAAAPVRPDGRLDARPVDLALDYVAGAEIVESVVNDYIHKTLLVRLTDPMAVVSTLEGFREGIRWVGNSYSPPQVWGLYHRIGLEKSREQLMRSIGRDRADTSLLFTGADMDHLALQHRQHGEMNVYALVTAGVCSNAMRMGADEGAYCEPGTINVLILADRQLSPRAMQRAVISATEAKSAALQDMDIRSAYTPLTNSATGTGTDNIIVVQGAGPPAELTGGHTKLGELIAKAVYAGVQEAVFKQNGVAARRNLFQRLKDRKIGLFGLVDDCPCGMRGLALTGELEKLLLNPVYAGFIAAALALSDQHERGLIEDLRSFEAWCDQTAAAVAGSPVTRRQDFVYARPLPPVLELAFDALLNGIYTRSQLQESTP